MYTAHQVAIAQLNHLRTVMAASVRAFRAAGMEGAAFDLLRTVRHGALDAVKALLDGESKRGMAFIKPQV